MNFKYSDYCTAYYVPEYKAVCVYDEIKDRELQRIPVENESCAARVIRSWEDNAPRGIIAERL